MKPGLSNEPFQAYLFKGSPPRQPRLWFLDRHLDALVPLNDKIPDTILTVTINIDVGEWTVTIPEDGELAQLYGTQLDDVIFTEPVKDLAGLCIRYEHAGTDPWSAVWRLTNVTIPTDPRDARRGFGITTFGRDDDVWRLGLWPD